MLIEFQVENFLSWVNLSFKPKDVNLLIGLNNSGKTNLCNALRFVSQTTYSTLDEALKPYIMGSPGLTNFSYKKPETYFKIIADVPYFETSLKYEYELTISCSPPDFPNLNPNIRIGYERLKVINNMNEEYILIENEHNNVSILNENINVKTISTPPHNSTMLYQVFDDINHSMSKNFKNYLSSWLYYDLSQNELRKFNYSPYDKWINSEGSNLSSVIYNLKKSDERSYRKLLVYLRLLEPDIDLINFVGGDTAEPNIFMRFEYKNGRSLPAWRASNGTLRFLALSYILTVQPSSFLIIEEPENGIFVRYLRKLLNLINENENNQQVLFTSHSPYFIDLFDDKLENIFISKKDQYRSDLSNIDIEKTKKYLNDYPLGEQHFQEILS